MKTGVALLSLGALACAGGAGRTAPRSSRQELTRFIDSSLADVRFRSARWGVLIVDPERGDTLYSRSAGKLFMPAYNQKLLTGPVALDVLGPAYRYATHFAAGGAIVDGVMQGGYVTTADGRLLMFSVLCNNWLVEVREVDRVADAIGVRLAELRLGR